MENEWDRALKAGKEVFVDIKPKYIGDSLRPSKLNINYLIDGNPGQTIFRNTRGGK